MSRLTLCLRLRVIFIPFDEFINTVLANIHQHTRLFVCLVNFEQRQHVSFELKFTCEKDASETYPNVALWYI